MRKTKNSIECFPIDSLKNKLARKIEFGKIGLKKSRLDFRVKESQFELNPYIVIDL